MTLIGAGVFFLALIAIIGVAYAKTAIPNPNSSMVDQASTLYFSDGKTVLGTYGTSADNRVNVPISQIPMVMQDAVIAAEDRSFRTEPGFSITGTARAALHDVFGSGGTQGGSTITQELVKNYYLNDDQTVSRKIKELFLSVKISNKYSKNQILDDYLNAVYMGRGAYGVVAAAKVYFNIPESKLSTMTAPQAAVLAASLEDPNYYDPLSTTPSEKSYSVSRYQYVLTNMARDGVVSETEAQSDIKALPKIQPENSGEEYAGQNGFMISRSISALKSLGYTDQELQTGGLKIVTTWNAPLQKKAASIVHGYMRQYHMPTDTRIGIVVENPTNGELLAAYGGANYLKREVDDAYYSTAQIGSSMKAFVLAAALEQGIGLKSTFNASSPAWINTNGDRVAPNAPGAFEYTNDEGNDNQTVNLTTAFQRSLNTVFVPLGFKAGTSNVVNVTKAVGLPQNNLVGKDTGSFFLGESAFSPLDMASAYGAIANNGTYVEPHSIKQVLNSSGRPVQQGLWSNWTKRQAIPSAVVSNMDVAMHAVVEPGGTGTAANIDGRNIAGKTGTTNNNQAAWFSGFTPGQLVASVGMWTFNDKTHRYGKSMNDIGGLSQVDGGTFPAMIWHDLMSYALNNKSVTNFPTVVPVGTTQPFSSAIPKPSKSPQPSNSSCPPGMERHGRCSITVPTTPTCTTGPLDPGGCQPTNPSPSPSNTQPTCVLGNCNTKGNGG
jgi:membrane peptidoglycan carboxypeptidase